MSGAHEFLPNSTKPYPWAFAPNSDRGPACRELEAGRRSVGVVALAYQAGIGLEGSFRSFHARQRGKPLGKAVGEPDTGANRKESDANQGVTEEQRRRRARGTPKGLLDEEV